MLAGHLERVDHEGLSEAAAALVAAYGEPGDVRLGVAAVVGLRDHDVGDADDAALGVGDDAEVPRLEAGAALDRGHEVVVGLALAHRPLEEGVLDDLVRGGPLVGPGLADGVPLGQLAADDLGAFRQLQHPAGVAHVVAERLEQPVTGRALRHGHADDRGAAAAGGVLHPEGQAGADAAAAVRRVHGRVAAVTAGDLGVADEPLLTIGVVEDADGLGRDVEAGPTPVADDVGLLDLDHPDVVHLGGRHHLVDGASVGQGERTLREALGQGRASSWSRRY